MCVFRFGLFVQSAGGCVAVERSARRCWVGVSGGEHASGAGAVLGAVVDAGEFGQNGSENLADQAGLDD